MSSVTPTPLLPLTAKDHIVGLLGNSLVAICNPIWIFIGFLMFLLSLTKIGFYTLSENNMKKYQGKAIWSTETGANGKKTGVIVGKWFVGIAVAAENKWCSDSMKVLALRSTHKKLSGTDDQEEKKSITPITFNCWSRGGTRMRVNFSAHSVEITKKNPRDFQQLVIDGITTSFEEKGTAAVLLSGPPGCGKSYIANVLIKWFAETRKIKCNLTDDFRPTEAGILFQTIYDEVGPTEDSILIVLIDEVDGILRSIGGSGISPHDKFFTQIKTKTEWNSFFDHVNEGRWKNTIFILTTNYTLDQIDDIDSSYMRPGRMNDRFQINPKGQVIHQIPAEDHLGWNEKICKPEN